MYRGLHVCRNDNADKNILFSLENLLFVNLIKFISQFTLKFTEAVLVSTDQYILSIKPSLSTFSECIIISLILNINKDALVSHFENELK